MKTTAPPSPHVISPTAIYSRRDVCRALHLSLPALTREVSSGRLRVSRLCGRYWFLGQFLLDWLERGAVDLPPAVLAREVKK